MCSVGAFGRLIGRQDLPIYEPVIKRMCEPLFLVGCHTRFGEEYTTEHFTNVWTDFFWSL